MNKNSARIFTPLWLLVLVVAGDVDAYCKSREGQARQYGEDPLFMIVGCARAEDFLARNQRYLRALAEDDKFARDMERRGVESRDWALTLTPINQAAVSLMLGKQESTWYYNSQCDDVPLHAPVTLSIKQACSDAGYTFVSFFDDMRIEEIIKLH
jgi:hypothetical protein